ncbi:hypothetical protein NN3_24840 [Nocardia neocaledoniensis NBRC 108232]|nr:hypothetical protein NN3_24840 [Nocardia neocaledoniensis NBRC 108232]
MRCRDRVVGAVVAPTTLGKPAMAQLAAGFVVAHTWSSRMTFLTAPGDQSDIESLSRALLRSNIATDAAAVVLPSPRDERCGYRQWESPPCPGPLLPMLTVIEAILGVSR